MYVCMDGWMDGWMYGGVYDCVYNNANTSNINSMLQGGCEIN